MDNHLARMNYLASVLRKYQTTAPELTVSDLVIVLIEETDINKLLKEIKKKNKK